MILSSWSMYMNEQWTNGIRKQFLRGDIMENGRSSKWTNQKSSSDTSVESVLTVAPFVTHGCSCHRAVTFFVRRQDHPRDNNNNAVILYFSNCLTCPHCSHFGLKITLFCISRWIFTVDRIAWTKPELSIYKCPLKSVLRSLQNLSCELKLKRWEANKIFEVRCKS